MKQKISILLVLLTYSLCLSAQKLIEAVDAKDYTTVEECLKNGDKVNKTNKKNSFPLWIAVWNNDSRMVDLLLKNGADPNQKFKGKDAQIACLEIAAQEGFLEIAQLLVSANADINVKGVEGFTPLRIAAGNGRLELVKYFASKGAEIDTKGNDGATPLEHAAGKGHLEIVQFLAENGANINHQDKDGDSPLGEAARHGHIDVVNYLLSKGANTTLKNKDGSTAEELAKFAGQPKVEAAIKAYKQP